ncbi:Clr5 domain-containing protein [Dactylonectria estremocensis]|uniref:Clr5 domain-containing protein n=1 Tax=Dactylonectria estremocensis TaxID=1079267 RepID=A0A9P9DFW3_9HYPO|nr:Clr5 domain-containing protein [Dactylonectria estremocensis]
MSSNAHTEDEWARMQPHITKLYSDEAKPLKEVMEILEQGYGFHATPRMYKHRLQKWGLDKKYKEREVIFMSLLKQQRDALGKQSVFYVRGRRVNWGQIEKYLHRRPDLQTKIRAGMLKLNSSGSDVVCSSPPPDPILHASITLQYTDELLRLLDGYYTSKFVGIPVTDGADLVRDDSITIRCLRKLDQARTMIYANMVEFGFRILNEALDDLRFVVRGEYATLMFDLFDVVTLFDQRHSSLTTELLRHAYGILLITFGDRHPLVWLMRRFIALPERDRYEIIASLMKAVVERCERLNVNGRMVERIKCHHFLLLDHMEVNETMTTTTFPEIDVATQDAVSTGYLGRLAGRLIFNQQFEEADRKTEQMLPWLQSPENRPNPCWPDIQMFYYHIRAHGTLMRGDDEAGQAWLEMVKQHSARYFSEI